MRNIKSMAMGSGDGRNPRAVGLRLEIFTPSFLSLQRHGTPPRKCKRMWGSGGTGAKSSIAATRDDHG